ncbi:hypothetical protein OIU84_028166 [Salix udensis]|uniref:RRM domain-containing protein n=2 Tax=Salix TaxID=40685 RepID=A0AAD6P8P5_9ROSI|nr:hypothetical protein OIU84_028166 [Salix udensis]
MSGRSINSVFYAETYHPIQAGSIDGTDTAPHDNAVYRALLCSSAGLYDPFGDPKAIGDPYCTIFIGRLSHLTTEDTLRKAMSKYGKVKNLRLVRHIGNVKTVSLTVTGASRGYGFVEFETEREMRRAYKKLILADFQLSVLHRRVLSKMETLSQSFQPPGWDCNLDSSCQIQAFFNLTSLLETSQTIPHDDLKRLGIPPPPEGRYMSHYEVPSPPRRKRSSREKEESSHRKSSIDKEEHKHRSSSVEAEESYNTRSYRGKEENYSERHSVEKEERRYKDSSMDRSERSHRRISPERGGYHHNRSSLDREEHSEKRISPVDMEEASHKKLRNREERNHKRSSRDREEGSRKRHKHGSSDKRRREDV